MLSKGKINIILALCLTSIVSIGFSSWVMGLEGSEVVGNIEVDNITYGQVSNYGLTYGESSTTIEYIKHKKGNSSSYSIYVCNYELSILMYLDLNNTELNELAYDVPDRYVNIDFSFVNYDNSVNNKLSSLELSLVNSTNICFEYLASQTSPNHFEIPLKSKEFISLYTMSKFDYTLPDNSGYNVPILFTFKLDKSSFKQDIITSGCNYSVIFTLGGGNKNE